MSQLAKNEVAAFTNADVLDQLTGQKGPLLWLGRYTEGDVLHLLERFSIYPALKATGFAEIVVAIKPVDRFTQALKIFGKTPDAKNQLAEFRLREVSFSHPCLVIGAPLNLLKLEWLMLQNPQADFTPERPRLPGQRRPGLGLAKAVLQLLTHLAAENKLAGVLNFPEFFHNAYFYLEYFYYCNPQLKGIVLALRRDLYDLSLDELSWAIYRGCVVDANTGQAYAWQADALVLPFDEQIKKHFHSPEYEQIVYDTMSTSSFVLNEQKFHEVYS